jgi:hypothetical protein
VDFNVFLSNFEEAAASGTGENLWQPPLPSRQSEKLPEVKIFEGIKEKSLP